jgi:hypothetical protein
VTDDADEETIGKRIHQAAVGEVRRLGGQPGGRWPVAAATRTVAARALTIEQRFARLDVTVGRRRGDGTRTRQDEEGRGDGEQRDKADGDE